MSVQNILRFTADLSRGVVMTPLRMAFIRGEDMGHCFLIQAEQEGKKLPLTGASVNGFMCDPFWAHTAAAGKRSNTTISWMASDFEANSITEVESLTLPIRVYDADDWSSASLVEDTFTLNP